MDSRGRLSYMRLSQRSLSCYQTSFLGPDLWGSEGDTGESGAAVVITGTGETPVPLRLCLTSRRFQPRLDAAGQGDELIQALAALGALGFLQVHGLRCALEAPQE